MLIEFRVENHRSIREEQVLTMTAGRGSEPEDPRPRKIAGAPEPVLPVAAIYGANASGKSNVLAAMAFMRDAVVESHRSWAPRDWVARQPFAWGGAPEKPSLFEATFVVDGTRFEYGFAMADEAFLEEWLFAWPHGRKQVWFERDRQEFKFGEQLRGRNRLVAEITRPNALFVSAAAQLQHEQLAPVYRAMAQLEVTFRRRSGPGFATGSSKDSRTLIGRRGGSHDRLLELLRCADLGITALKLVDEPSFGTTTEKAVYLRHQASGDSWLRLSEESRGTQDLFHLAASLLDALDHGGVLLIDELERSLHPLLALQLVRQFNDPVLNPKNAQLIFTTHDTNLLGTVVGDPALRRDQVWLTEKDPEGATKLYPLTDYQPRKQENVERGYLQGRYGAIPFLGALVPPEVE